MKKLLFCYAIFLQYSVSLCQDTLIGELCYSGPLHSYGTILIPSQTENPYSRALGQRIAGYVVGATGILNLVLGIIFDGNNTLANWYDDLGLERETGEMYEKLIIVEGGIRSILGGVFLGIGFSKYNQWKKWEMNNGSISLKQEGSSIALEFCHH